MAYLSVTGECAAEKIIEKSRFLAYAAHVESETEAKDFLARLRGEHPLATHVCYGYVSDKLGNEQRFSDDNEPQGTAGMPILNVIKAQKLYETAVAVVRYFGGIKLGAGGLTRAYSSSAAEVIASSKKCLFDTCVEIAIAVDYAQINAATRFFEENACEILSRNFGESAEFIAAVRECGAAEFQARLNDYLNGKARFAELTRRYFPFPAESIK